MTRSKELTATRVVAISAIAVAFANNTGHHPLSLIPILTATIIVFLGILLTAFFDVRRMRRDEAELDAQSFVFDAIKEKIATTTNTTTDNELGLNDWLLKFGPNTIEDRRKVRQEIYEILNQHRLMAGVYTNDTKPKPQ